MLDLHAALGATIGACAARGALDEHASTQALEALLCHTQQRWAHLLAQCGAGGALTAGGAEPQPAALTAAGGAVAKEAAALLRLSARVADACCGAAVDAAGGGAAGGAGPIPNQGGRVALVCVLRAVAAVQPQATSFSHAASAALSRLVASADAARYAHAFATKEARALRALRAAALDLVAICARRCAHPNPNANPSPNPNLNPSPNPTPTPSPNPNPSQVRQRAGRRAAASPVCPPRHTVPPGAPAELRPRARRAPPPATARAARGAAARAPRARRAASGGPAATGGTRRRAGAPCISLHPNASPYISVHLPTSPCISPGAAQELTTAATAPGADGSAAAAAASLGAAAMSLLKGCARQHGASLAPHAPALAASLPSALEWGLTVTLSSGAQRRHDALTRILTPKYAIAQTITATLTLTATLTPNPGMTRSPPRTSSRAPARCRRL